MSTINPGCRGHGGFTLVEILVTMFLMSITLLVLAPVSLKVAAMSTQSTVAAQRSGVLSGEVQRLQLVAFEDLSTGRACTNFPTADFPHTRCVTVTSMSADSKRVTVTVTPTSAPARADSTVMDRHRGSPYNPLNPS